MTNTTERTEQLRLDLSPDEKGALRQIAAIDGVSMADVVRAWIRQAAPARLGEALPPMNGRLDAVIRNALTSGCDESGQITEPLAAALSLFVWAIAAIVVYALAHVAFSGLLAWLPF